MVSSGPSPLTVVREGLWGFLLFAGVAWLAIASGAPVVPVALLGTERILPVGARVPRPVRRPGAGPGAPMGGAAGRTADDGATCVGLRRLLPAGCGHAGDRSPCGLGAGGPARGAPAPAATAPSRTTATAAHRAAQPASTPPAR